jgi:hypothetical protein
VNEDEQEDIIVGDEERYEALLEKRQDRRVGEPLYDFLERQVKGQMRDALGQPLENISQFLLNKVVSKEVKNNLKKYKSAVGKTPGKTPHKTPGKDRAGRSAEKYSPARKLHFEGSPEKGEEGPMVSREIRDLIKRLNAGISDRDSLLKMLLIKCSDADQSYKSAKNEINKGNVNEVER